MQYYVEFKKERNLKFEAFSRCFGSLCGAIAHPEWLAAMFCQEGLVSTEMIPEMLVLGVPSQHKTMKLMYSTLSRIKYDPDAFDLVVAILARDRSLEPLVGLLNKTLEALSPAVTSPLVSMMPKIQLTGTLCGPRYQRYCSVVYKYLYDAKYLHLYAYTKLLLNSPSIDLRVFGMLSRSSGYFYSGRVKRGYRLLLKALKLCDSPSCQNGAVLRARVFCCLSSLFKNYGNHVKAMEYLKFAQEGVSLIEVGYDSSVVALQNGCMSAELQRIREAEVGCCQAIKLKDSLDESHGPLYIVHQKASIALAMVYLNCSCFHVNLNTPVSDLQLRKAASLLERVATEEFIPRRTMVEFDMARSILCFKMNKVSEAVRHASSATRLSSECGLAGNLHRTPGLLLQVLRDFKKTS